MKKYLINPLNKKAKISDEIYGHFSEHLGRCIYGGIYVGDDNDIPNVNGMRNDVVKALRDIKISALRWPGGCFADEYHWKDGIGPKSQRKKMINTNWGGVVEDNSFGTHEFFELCRQLNCEPYITVNVGSGTVEEASEWIEYMTFDGTSPMADLRRKNGSEEPFEIKYIGIGNESWGCGGNMTPQYYSDVYRRFNTFIKNFGNHKLFRIACGPSNGDYNWTNVVMKNNCSHMDGLSLHYYTIPSGDFSKKGSATEFDTAEYYRTLKETLRMDELVSNHSKIMDIYDPKKRVALIVDEWGAWYDVEKGTNPGFLYQQNSMRDAMIAAINLNIFNKHSDRVRMANIAQLVNVLQSPILTEGSKMILTPTYYAFKLYNDHHGATLCDSFIESDKIECGDSEIPSLNESASIAQDGSITATVCNLSAESDCDIELTVFDKDIKNAEAIVLHGRPNDVNTFDNPDVLKPETLDVIIKDGRVLVNVPSCSVLSIKLS